MIYQQISIFDILNPKLEFNIEEVLKSLRNDHLTIKFKSAVIEILADELQTLDSIVVLLDYVAKYGDLLRDFEKCIEIIENMKKKYVENEEELSCGIFG